MERKRKNMEEEKRREISSWMIGTMKPKEERSKIISHDAYISVFIFMLGIIDVSHKYFID